MVVSASLQSLVQWAENTALIPGQLHVLNNREDHCTVNFVKYQKRLCKFLFNTVVFFLRQPIDTSIEIDV